MREYFDEAIILTKEPSGEADAQVTFFAHSNGKISARAKSVRKITSKLAAHLEPGSLSQVRWVEKNGLNLIDALRLSKLALTPLDLHFLDALIVDDEPDEMLWQALTQPEFSWRATLAQLGWDPTQATCQKCGKKLLSAGSRAAFYLKTQEFFCEACAATLRIPPSEVLYID